MPKDSPERFRVRACEIVEKLPSKHRLSVDDKTLLIEAVAADLTTADAAVEAVKRRPMSIHTPPLVAVCPRCSHIHGREIPTMVKDVYTFSCPACGFVWTNSAKEPFQPPFRKP